MNVNQIILLKCYEESTLSSSDPTIEVIASQKKIKFATHEIKISTKSLNILTLSFEPRMSAAVTLFECIPENVEEIKILTTNM